MTFKKGNKSSFKKGHVPWNKGLTGKKYKKHYENGFKNQHTNHRVIKIEKRCDKKG